MSDKLAKIVDQLSELTVLEAAELAKKLETHWGVSASAAMAVAVAAAPAEAVEVQTEFDVILEGVEAEKKMSLKKFVLLPA